MPYRAARFILAALLTLGACAQDPATGPALVPLDAADFDGGPRDDGASTEVASSDVASEGDGAAAPADPAAALYARDRIVQVAIELAPAAWDTLRAQGRTLFDILGPGCLDAPQASPFTWFSATVTVDGQTLTHVGVRKKGFLGSLDEQRPSLKIEFDELVEGQKLGGVERLTLNNGRQDPSRLATCLSYDVFAAAGVPAPRCNFARVTVNGTDLGVYVNVEPVKKPLLRRHFGEDDGVLYEGALSDFRPEWRHTFDLKQPKPAPSPPPLDPLLEALAAPDEELLGALDAVLDLDAFLSFWAAEVLVGHWDGYAGNANNFYVYRATSDGRWRFLPWGADATFVTHEDRLDAPASVMATGAVAHRLYQHPEGRALYLARLEALLETAWRPDERVAEIDRLEAELVAHVPADRRAEFAVAVAARRAWVLAQQGRVRAELDAGGVAGPASLRPAICMQEAGEVAVTFETTWGTALVDNLFTTGSGSMSVAVAGQSWPVAMVGAKAGPHPDKPGVGLIAVAGQLPGGNGFAFVWVEFPLAAVAPGAEIPLDGTAIQAVLMHVLPGQEPKLVGLCATGSLSLSQVGLGDGDPIVGALDSPVWTF